MQVVELDTELDYTFESDVKGGADMKIDDPFNITPTKDKDETNEVESHSVVESFEADTKAKQELRSLIYRYLSNNRFKTYLKDHGFSGNKDKINEMSESELKDLLQKIQLAVQNRTRNLSQEFVFEILNGMEYIIITFSANKIKVKGMSKALQEDESFLDALEEIHLMWVTDKLSSPYERIAWTIFTTAMKTHGLNTAAGVLTARGSLANESKLQAEQGSVSILPSSEARPTQQPLLSRDPRVTRFAEDTLKAAAAQE